MFYNLERLFARGDISDWAFASSDEANHFIQRVPTFAFDFNSLLVALAVMLIPNTGTANPKSRDESKTTIAVMTAPHIGATMPTPRNESGSSVDACIPGNTSSTTETSHPSLVVFDLDGIETRRCDCFYCCPIVV